VDQRASTAPLAIDVLGLRKSFGTVQAVAGVDLAIAPGEVVALLGPNGAGKSTTVDMLLGLSRPDSGEVKIFGREPTEATRAGLVGATLQAGGVVDRLTVRELITVMCSLSPSPLPVDEVLDLVGLRDIAGQRTEGLSGGQTQRVRFAMAVAGDPDLLVLDEPTVAMDVSARRAFWETMRSWTARGRTVVFATHYLEEADAFADRVVLMAHGRIVADGSTTEIKAAVGGRTVRATLPGAVAAELRRLPGVTDAELHGQTVILRCSDSDAALRALLTTYEQARDIEVSGAGLEEAFLALTGDPVPDALEEVAR